MANFIRSAKSGNDWTLNDLDSYHINLNQLDALSFFGLQELPPPSVDPELLTNADASAMRQDHHAELITYLDLAMIPQKGETAVNDFTVELFKTSGLCSSRTSGAHADGASAPYLRRKQARNDESHERLENWEQLANARAQLVAEAVGAFNENNAQRETAGLPPMEEKESHVMPGIVMVGTSPAFFKIPVTQTLSTHIRHGTYPPEETHVTYCYPPVPRPNSRHAACVCVALRNVMDS